MKHESLVSALQTRIRATHNRERAKMKILDAKSIVERSEKEIESAQSYIEDNMDKSSNLFFHYDGYVFCCVRDAEGNINLYKDSQVQTEVRSR